MKALVRIMTLLCLMLMMSGFTASVQGQEKLYIYETYTLGEVQPFLEKDKLCTKLLDQAELNKESSLIARVSAEDADQLLDHLRILGSEAGLPPDIMFLPGKGSGQVNIYALKSGPDTFIPDSEEIKSVSILEASERGSWDVGFHFDERGAARWAEMTRKNIGHDLAIVYAGEVLAAPRVMDEIKRGKCLISGDFTEDEALELQSVLGSVSKNDQ